MCRKQEICITVQSGLGMVPCSSVLPSIFLPGHDKLQIFLYVTNSSCDVFRNLDFSIQEILLQIPIFFFFLQSLASLRTKEGSRGISLEYILCCQTSRLQCRTLCIDSIKKKNVNKSQPYIFAITDFYVCILFKSIYFMCQMMKRIYKI